MLWADRERREREQEQDIGTVLDAWEDIRSWFPFLPLPAAPEAETPEAFKRACADRLMAVPSLGTFTRSHLPAPLLPPEERRRHLYVVGKTGSGKTTLLEHLMLRDLEAGHGIGVMAPEGELFRGRLLPLIPASRRLDVIYFAPGDPACPLTFNPLAVEEGDDALRAAEDLFTIFKRALSGDELGPRMQPILQNAFAVLVGRPGMTLWDVKRLLTDASFRERIVATTADPYIREFWETTFPRFSKGADLPLLSRLDHFLRPPAVRRSLCHPFSSFSIRTALLEKKILLLDLFGLSEETQRLLGQMLLSKFQIELMRRELSGGSPPTFFLYCDEFQAFAGFAEGVWRELLSRGRKYGLALTLAHQFPAQLPGALQEEIFGNVNSLFSFGLGAKDAQVMRKEFLTTGEKGTEPLAVEEILELQVGQAYGKLAGGRAVKLSMPPPVRVKDPSIGQEVIAGSWYIYGAPAGVSGGVTPEEAASDMPQQEPADAAKEQGEQRAAPPKVAPRPAEKHRMPEEPIPTPPRSSPPKREKKAPTPPPPLGRGGPEHQYLQEFVKRFGESKGFRVTVEQPVLDGQGSVDVVLEREGWRLACEISVTTGVEQEIGNVEKCLAAGFDVVAVISPKERHLEKLNKALGKKLSPDTLSRIHFLTPEDIGPFLDALPVPADVVETVGGYQVKVSYRRSSAGEEASRKRAVAEVIARSLKRLQRKAE